jgi:hypothetical protein
MAEVKPTYVYDPADPGNHPAAGPPPEDVWIEGDHPTDNPDGVTVSNHDYWPKTQEEKAELLGVEMVDPIEVPLDEPYPEGEQWQSREDLLKSIHSPQELVEAKDFAEQHERNLRAGGSVEMKDVMVSDEIAGKSAAGSRSRKGRAQADQENEARRGLR